ncbi:hypothetical protein [Antarctobacter jejuensis]|uniref:hypothetical protein n=1 Tax=Antarctobacter jejuensis TaxID=1439938 RepID=UPI003FCFC246
MKPLIVSTLIATAGIAGTAQALTGPTLSGEAGYILPGADFSTLSAAQIHAINALVHSGDSFNEKRAGIEAQQR